MLFRSDHHDVFARLEIIFDGDSVPEDDLAAEPFGSARITFEDARSHGGTMGKFGAT